MWLLVVRFSLGLVYVVTLCALWVVFRLWMLWGLIGLINSVVYSYLVVYFDTFVVWLIVCELVCALLRSCVFGLRCYLLELFVVFGLSVCVLFGGVV